MRLAEHTPALAGGSRSDILATLLIALAEARGALQGPRDAATTWAARNDLADLDVWVPAGGLASIAGAIDTLGAVRVAADDRPGRLRHHQWWVPTATGDAIVDVTVGDLRVGPVLLCPEADVTTTVNLDNRQTGIGPRLTGPAAVVDLALRPLLRGRLPGADRLDEARTEWAALRSDRRARLLTLLAGELGVTVSGDVAGVLDGRPPVPALVDQVRRRLIRSSLQPRHIADTWHARHTITGRRNGPFGVPARGVVVALVGTDGSGKSTVSSHLAGRLEQLGFTVRPEYFGMARANLPGVGVVRRMVRGSDAESIAPRLDDEPVEGDRPVRHAMLRRLGAWAYALDYTWRSVRRVRPAVRRNEIVLCDRWVTDLRRQPWPNSPAAGVAERLVGAPDVLALAWAPAEVIHARKAERTLDETLAEQAAMRVVLDEYDRPGTAAVLVDTDVSLPRSGETGGIDHPLSALLRSVLAAAH